MATRSWWGWGNREDAVTGREREALTKRVAALLPTADLTVHDAPDPTSLEVPARRVRVPDSLATLATLASEDLGDRVAHGSGQAFRDVVRNLLGRVDQVPVKYCGHAPSRTWSTSWTGVRARASPWCRSAAGRRWWAVSNPRCLRRGRGPRHRRMDRIVELDRTSRAARIQAGILGPALEAGLRPEGLTLRHFPQSFEFSTLGGWLATRAGGHYATVYTHIDDMVESMRVVTPAGINPGVLIDPAPRLPAPVAR
jgi:alkyldihydroxyacetonephosphate synthase